MDDYLDEVLDRLMMTGMSYNDSLYLICCLLHEQARAFVYWEDFYGITDDEDSSFMA